MASYRDEVLADSPVAYWRLGEASGSFADSAGSNTASETGTVTRDVANASLKEDDGAVAFPSAGNYISAPDATALDLGDGPFTIEVWAKRTSDTGTYEIALSKGTNGYAVGVAGGGSIPDKWGLFKDNVAVLCGSTASVPADSSWHHYVITRSAAGAGNTKVYVDGTEGHTDVSIATTLADTTEALQIGRDATGDPPFLGGLDELAIYKSVLSSTRVSAHYAARSAAVLAGTSVAASTASAVLTTPGAALAGTAGAVSTGAAVLTTTIALAANSAGASTAASVLTTGIAVVGSSAAVAVASGSLTTQVTLAGLAAAQSVAVAALTEPAAALAGLSDTFVIGVGALTTGIPVAGAVAGESTAGAVLTTGIQLAGLTAGQSDAAGDLTAPVSTALAGIVAALSGASGTLVALLPNGRHGGYYAYLQPEKEEIVAKSLYDSLVSRYGAIEGPVIYRKMQAERKGPFAPTGKYASGGSASTLRDFIRRNANSSR